MAPSTILAQSSNSSDVRYHRYYWRLRGKCIFTSCWELKKKSMDYFVCVQLLLKHLESFGQVKFQHWSITFIAPKMNLTWLHDYWHQFLPNIFHKLPWINQFISFTNQICIDSSLSYLRGYSPATKWSKWIFLSLWG